MKSVKIQTVLSIVLVLAGAAHSREGFFDDVRSLPGLGGKETEAGCSVTADGQELYSDHWRNHYDIWVSRPREDGSWGTPVIVQEVSTSDMDAAARVSGDGLTLAFGRRPRSLSAHAEMYLASRDARDEPWGNVRPLVEINDPVQRDWPGSLSADKLILYFVSGRREDDFGNRSKGAEDLYVATRASRHEPFASVRNIQELNGPWSDTQPSLSADGLTIFWADLPFAALRPGGQGSPDLWMATRASLEAPFGPARNIGTPVNSAIGDFMPFVSADWPADGSKLYFARSVDGSRAYLYEATWHAATSPAFLRGDCAGDGTVDISDGVCILN